MKDIDAIKESVETLRDEVKDGFSGIKIWVLSGVIGTVVLFAIPTLTLFYDAGQKAKEIEMYSKRVDLLEGHK